MRIPAPVLLVSLLAALAMLAGACTAEEAGRARVETAPLYVAIGASDSVGTGAENPTTEGWVAQLYQKMPPGTRLANLGVGGILIHQALDQELPVAVDLKPSVVTVWLGVNDVAAGVPLDAYRADLDSLLGTLQHQTQARVYVANLPDLTLLPAFRQRPTDELHAEVARWNAVIAAAAQAHGAALVDVYSGWAELRTHPELISRDGLHPSTAGHRRLAELFWQTMEGAKG